MAGGTQRPSIDADTAIASARAGEPDRYLAALLAPPPARDGLLALAAFASELARVPQVTHEPMMGEVRLQWWHDALDLPAAGARTGHPVGDALRAAIERHRLPRDQLHGMIDARALDLGTEALPDDAALQGYLWRREGVLFALAARVLGHGAAGGLDSAAVAAGSAYGLARLLTGLPQALARGRLPLPQARLDAAGLMQEDLLEAGSAGKVAALLGALRAESRAHLVTSRQHVSKLPRQARVAFLPLALVEPYLRTMERRGVDPLRESIDVSPFARVARIAAALWLGRP